MNLSEIIQRVKTLGQEIHRRAVKNQKDPAALPIVPSVMPLTSEPSPPQKSELKEYLDGLPAEYLLRLVTIVSVGREGRRPGNSERLRWLCQDVLKTHGSYEGTLNWVKGISASNIVMWLNKALKRLEQRGIDVDDW